jgi:hypothetical protein
MSWKGITNKKEARRACLVVATAADTNRPIPVAAGRNKDAEVKKRDERAGKGTANQSCATSRITVDERGAEQASKRESVLHRICGGDAMIRLASLQMRLTIV